MAYEPPVAFTTDEYPPASKFNKLVNSIIYHNVRPYDIEPVTTAFTTTNSSYTTIKTCNITTLANTRVLIILSGTASLDTDSTVMDFIARVDGNDVPSSGTLTTYRPRFLLEMGVVTGLYTVVNLTAAAHTITFHGKVTSGATGTLHIGAVCMVLEL